MKKVITMAVLALMLSSCAYDETSSTKVGEVDGCAVFKLRIRGEYNPLYLAKYPDAKTTSITYETGGKGSHPVSTTTRTEER